MGFVPGIDEAGERDEDASFGGDGSSRDDDSGEAGSAADEASGEAAGEGAGEADPGQAASGAGDMTAADAATPNAGRATPGGIEIRLLVYRTLGEIADAVAAACARRLGSGKGTPLYVTDPDGARAIADAQVLDQTLRSLLAALRATAAALDGKAERKPGEAGGELEIAPATIAAGAQAVLTEATTLVGSLHDLLARLAVTDAYESREVSVEPGLLPQLVAARCLDQGLAPVVIGEGQTMPTASRLPDLVPQIQCATARLALTDSRAWPQLSALAARSDAVLAALSKGAGPAALALARAMAQHPQAPVLVVRPLAAGGAYRSRRHILTVLGLVPTLSFSAGAAVQYMLTERASGRLLAGDLLYAASGNLRLPTQVTRTALSNLPPHG